MHPDLFFTRILISPFFQNLVFWKNTVMKILPLLLLNQVVYVEKKANTLCFVYNSPVVNVSQRFVKLSARASAHVRVL